MSFMKPEFIPTNIPVTTSPRILDSGNRREFESGAVRDMQEGKGRCDLMPLDVVSEMFFVFTHAANADGQAHFKKIGDVFSYISLFTYTGVVKYLYLAIQRAEPFDSPENMLLEVAKHFEEGCKKYGENNWRKGIPAHCYIDSAVRHYLKYLRGDNDEPHDRAFCWNILCCIWTCKHKPELNDYAKNEKETVDND